MTDIPQEWVEKARELIAAERKRQIDVEGWSAEHDREHGPAALYHAATAYEVGDPGWWPWHRQWWKPKDALSNLIRAGALYQAAAEVARTGTYHDPSFYGQCRERVAETIAALLSAVLAVLPEVRRAPVVDTGAVARALHEWVCADDLLHNDETSDPGCLERADNLLRALDVQDAADVRREVAEEIAAAIRARAGRDMVLTHEAAADTAAIALHIGAGLLEVRIAREVGGRDE